MATTTSIDLKIATGTRNFCNYVNVLCMESTGSAHTKKKKQYRERPVFIGRSDDFKRLQQNHEDGCDLIDKWFTVPGGCVGGGGGGFGLLPNVVNAVELTPKSTMKMLNSIVRLPHCVNRFKGCMLIMVTWYIVDWTNCSESQLKSFVDFTPLLNFFQNVLRFNFGYLLVYLQINC